MKKVIARIRLMIIHTVRSLSRALNPNLRKKVMKEPTSKRKWRICERSVTLP